MTQTQVQATERMHWLERFIFHACKNESMTFIALRKRVKKTIEPYTSGDIRLTTTEMVDSGILTRLDDGRLASTGGPVP